MLLHICLLSSTCYFFPLYVCLILVVFIKEPSGVICCYYSCRVCVCCVLCAPVTYKSYPVFLPTCISVFFSTLLSVPLPSLTSFEFILTSFAPPHPLLASHVTTQAITYMACTYVHTLNFFLRFSLLHAHRHQLPSSIRVIINPTAPGTEQSSSCR